MQDGSPVFIVCLLAIKLKATWRRVQWVPQEHELNNYLNLTQMKSCILHLLFSSSRQNVLSLLMWPSIFLHRVHTGDSAWIPSEVCVKSDGSWPEDSCASPVPYMFFDLGFRRRFSQLSWWEKFSRAWQTPWTTTQGQGNSWFMGDWSVVHIG